MSITSDAAAADARLLAAIERARASEFYARHLAGCEIRSRADFPGLPRTTRTHLREAGVGELLIIPRTDAGPPLEFGGAPDERVSTWCGSSELAEMVKVLCEFVPELGARPSVLSRSPAPNSTAFLLGQISCSEDAVAPDHEGARSRIAYGDLVEMLQQHGPGALSCLPLEPLVLAEAASVMGVDLRKEAGSLELFLCGGAPLPPGLRSRIRADWGARVVEIYDSAETLLMGVSCENDQLHLATDLFEFEILDPQTWEPVPPGGRGVVTVTSLAHTAMPLVRYVTGDMVEIENQPCACGRAGFPVRLLGNCEEKIEIGGREAMPFDILDAAHTFAAEMGTRIFLAIVRPRDVRILVEVEDPSVSIPTRSYLDLRRRVGLPLDVELVGPNEILDRSVLLGSPALQGSAFIADWRKPADRAVSMTESLMEVSPSRAGGLFGRLRRHLRTSRRRRGLVRDLAGS